MAGADEGEEVSQTLPEDLVERIVAMVPFPSIFRARCLSRSWRARFSSISSLEDETQKCLAASFQKQVCRWSSKWETFAPVFIGKEHFIAYRPASQNWGRLPSLSFLPENLFPGSLTRFLARSYVQMEGNLLYGFAPGSRSYELHVANILTRVWRRLPPRPVMGTEGSYVPCTNLVMDAAEGKYRLILFCRSSSSDPEEGSRYAAQVFDSGTEAWSSTEFVVSGDFAVGPSPSAYLNGVLYMVSVNNPQNLLAIDVESGTLRELSLGFDGAIEIVSVNLVVCKVDWLMIVTKGLYPETLQVLKVDLQSLGLVELARGPPADLNVGKIIGQPVGDGSCLFFRVEDSGSRVLAYDLDKDEWSCFPVPAAANSELLYKWIGSSFQPGLSPFVAV